MKSDSKAITILGIDPGYDRLGWAILTSKGSKQTVLSYNCIQTDKKASIFSRYQQITSELTTVLETYQPQELAIENLYFSKNTTTALRVSEARGVIIGLCIKNNLTVFEYNPVTIKQTVTGHGQADKKAVEKMTLLQLGIKNDQKVVDDAIDALAIALTHSVSRKTKNLFQEK
jgi:crossover junction endodeoxyribonuclease RuvC